VAATDLTLHRLAELDDDALAELYAPPRTPWLRVNFVSTLDGAAQGPDGLSGSINNPVDNRVFNALRRRADVLVVGAGTLRDEAYNVPKRPLAVVSRSGVVPVKLREAPAGRVLMATVEDAPGLGEAREILGADNVLVNDGAVDLTLLKRWLAERGHVEQLSEGGPHLMHSLLSQGVADELCLTVVPRLIASDHLRIVAGTPIDVDLEPAVLLEQDGTIVGRWLVRR
jgi:riboflavin biosynthesis pyrimidine reductase